MAWHLPSHNIKTHRRQNIHFITPNNGKLNKYTSLIYCFNKAVLSPNLKAGGKPSTAGVSEQGAWPNLQGYGTGKDICQAGPLTP